MGPPVNLHKLLGDRFKVTRDEDMTDDTTRGDPWSFVIRGKRVCLYPHSSTLIAVEVDGSKGRVYRELARLGFTLYQDGDGEWTFHGTPAMFTDELLGMMRLPKRPPPLTAEQRQARIDRVAAYRFVAGHNGNKPSADRPPENVFFEGVNGPSETRDDSRVT